MEQKQLVDSPVDAFACTLAGLTATAQDGRTEPLDKCAWVEIAPCGCMSAITMAVSGDEVLMSAEKAQLQLSGSVAEAKRDTKNGNRLVLVMMSDYRNGVLDIFQRACTHDPKWGVVKPTRTVGGVTFTRDSPTRWHAEGGWEIDKLRSWYLSRPTDRSWKWQYLSSLISEAMEKAAPTIIAAQDIAVSE